MSASYDRIATWYDESVRNGSLIHDLVVPVMLDMMGNIEGKYICDLACGQGIISRLLVSKGAKVTGIDISEKLLELAHGYEETDPLGIRYIQGDVQNLPNIEDASFDGVLCNMSLMDIPDLSKTFNTVARILRPGGWFLASITHPCYQTPNSHWVNENGTISRAVSSYYNERFWYSNNPSGVRGQVGSYHRTLSTYLNTMTEAGLALERLSEPQATGKLAQRVPGYREVAAALIIKGRKS
jgi:ubiquinone/menaquinone biosynthesis C-methylase UbiE